MRLAQISQNGSLHAKKEWCSSMTKIVTLLENVSLLGSEFHRIHSKKSIHFHCRHRLNPSIQEYAKHGRLQKCQDYRNKHVNAILLRNKNSFRVSSMKDSWTRTGFLSRKWLLLYVQNSVRTTSKWYIKAHQQLVSFCPGEDQQYQCTVTRNTKIIKMEKLIFGCH